jgi:soluble lytic murein transglycosylase-like protein
VLALSTAVPSGAAETSTAVGAPTVQSSAPSAPSTSTNATAPETAPTLTVEPAPTPPPATTPQTRTAPPPEVPRVRVQRSQKRSRSSATGSTERGTVRPGAKGAAGAPGNGTTAVAPSALTPPLPLVFSASLAGIPAFFIESFRVPPFLLPIYQAAGTAYGVPWQVLAAINEVETDYGRDLSVSSAGAEGWMQFLPSSWALYGVDANGDGFKDPYNPADAIFAAARYLRAAGAATDLRAAIFAYNHSRAYVESVLLRARLLGGTPSELLGALSGLTQGRFPVHAAAHFSDGFPSAPSGSGANGTIAGTTIYSQAGAPVIAVQDGLVTRMGDSRELGRFISLRDAYGNTYTYAQLGSIARLYPVLQPHEPAGASPAGRGGSQSAEARPTAPASAGVQSRAAAPLDEGGPISGLTPASGAGSLAATMPAQHSSAPTSSTPGALPSSAPGGTPSSTPGGGPAMFRAGPNDVYLHQLRAGVRVIAGTVLGHVGAGAGGGPDATGEGASHMLFQIRPNGSGAPLIDPKPILDGWVQLENSSIYRAGGASPSPFLSAEPSPGQVLLESKQQLEQQVIASHSIDAGRCGGQDVRAGRVDRRVLATLEFLAVSRLKPTVSGLRCSGAEAAVGAQRSEQAVEIVALNNVPIAGQSASVALASATIRKLRALQGPLKPTTIAARDGGIEVSFAPPLAPRGHAAGAFSGAISPTQWIQLIARLGEIPSPLVRSGPSPASISDRAGAGAAEGGSGGNR